VICRYLQSRAASLGETNPGSCAVCYIQVPSDRWNNLNHPIKDAEDVDGPLGQIISRLDQKFERTFKHPLIYFRASRNRKPTFARGAAAACPKRPWMHRTYESTNAQCGSLGQRPDRDSNPGGPFGQSLSRNFGKPGGGDYRNPILRGHENSRYVQRFGVGIQQAKSRCGRTEMPDGQIYRRGYFFHVEIKRPL